MQALGGFPASAMVGFAADSKGRPVFSFSSISTHKQDLIVDPKASFMVAHKDFKVRCWRLGLACMECSCPVCTGA
jgi:putative heme iron utilization protein